MICASGFLSIWCKMIDKKDDDWKGEDKIKNVKKVGNNQNGINFKTRQTTPKPSLDRILQAVQEAKNDAYEKAAMIAEECGCEFAALQIRDQKSDGI